MERLRPLPDSDAFIEQSVGEVAAVLLYPYGFELDDEPRSFETALANAFGGEPFPAMARVRLADRRDGDGCVVRNSVRYRWDPGSGWIVGARAVRETTSEGRRRVDTTLIDVR